MYVSYTKMIPTPANDIIITNCNQLFDQLIHYIDLKIFR